MRKLLACLLLAVLPLTPSWAGVAVDCSGDTPVAVVVAAPAPGDHDGGATPECCAETGAQDVPCGSDCANCQGPGLTALTGVPAGVCPLATAPGDSTHTVPIAASVASEPFRPPSGAAA